MEPNRVHTESQALAKNLATSLLETLVSDTFPRVFKLLYAVCCCGFYEMPIPSRNQSLHGNYSEQRELSTYRQIFMLSTTNAAFFNGSKPSCMIATFYNPILSLVCFQVSNRSTNGIGLPNKGAYSIMLKSGTNPSYDCVSAIFRIYSRYRTH